MEQKIRTKRSRCELCGKYARAVNASNGVTSVPDEFDHVAVGGGYAVLTEPKRYHVSVDGGTLIVRGYAQAVVYGRGDVCATNNSSVECIGELTVEATGKAHVRARQRCVVYARDNARIECSGKSAGYLFNNATGYTRSLHSVVFQCSPTATGHGNVTRTNLPVKEQLKHCGVDVNPDGTVILYKSVRKDFTAFYDGVTKYAIGKEVVAPDWNKDKFISCGFGLHLSPTVWQARQYGDAGVYLACRVKIEDIAPAVGNTLEDTKFRVRACVPLYQVDVDGNPVGALDNGAAVVV